MEPKYVRPFLNDLHPDEQHGSGGDCLSPNCDYQFTQSDERDINDFDGHFTCPECDRSYNFFEVGRPGGTSKSGLTNTQMGQIAEQIIQNIGTLPELGPIIEYLGGDSYNSSLDMVVGPYGVEIKANHSEAQPRFKIGGEKVQDSETGQVMPARQAKYLYCQRNGLIPALVGVRLNFYTSKADIFVRKGSHAFDNEGFNDTWIGSPKLHYILTVDFSDLNPFSHPDNIPSAIDLPPGSWEDGEEATETSSSNDASIPNMHTLSKWKDVMEKAQRLRQANQVKLLNNSGEHVVGQVEGDNGTYECEIWRNDPNSRAIAYWNCECPWGEVSWGRTRQWKKYEGRMCSHALALFWEAQHQPYDEEPEMPEIESETPQAPEGQQGDIVPAEILPEDQPVEQPQEAESPAQEAPTGFNMEDLMTPAIPGGPNMPPPEAPAEEAPSDIVPAEIQQPEQPPMPMEPAVQTHPKQVGEGGPLDLPGALSSFTDDLFAVPFQNGDIVKVKPGMQVQGLDRDGQAHTIPEGTAGEIMYCDALDAIVMFPLQGSYLTPHLVKVETSPEMLYRSDDAQPFIKKRRG